MNEGKKVAKRQKLRNTCAKHEQKQGRQRRVHFSSSHSLLCCCFSLWKWLLCLLCLLLPHLVCMSQGILTIKGEEKNARKRIMCCFSRRSLGGGEVWQEQNLHTTPSFYSHLSAIFIFLLGWLFFLSTLQIGGFSSSRKRTNEKKE